METYAASHGKEEVLMTHVGRLHMRLVIAALVLFGSIWSAGSSVASATPEETVKAYLAAMKDQKFEDAYKQISKGMAGNKDVESWAKEQKYIFQTGEVKIFK